MSIIVELYQFKKKENSTAQPNRASASSFNCILKEECGIINPSIILDIGLSQSPSSYNYAYIPSFNRWYWIEEWTNIHPRWVASLKVDALASFKTDIGNTNLYVLRASNEYDGSIIDSLYPTKIYNTVSINSPNSDLWTSTPLANGTFVIGVVADYGAFGGLSYYALSYSNMRVLIHKLLEDGIKNNVHGYSDEDCSIALQKSLVDPLQYVKSCIYLPYSISEIIGNIETSISIWDWELAVDCKSLSLNNTFIQKDTYIELPQHPQQNTRGHFVNVAPYTEHTYSDGIFGDIPLDTVRLAYATNLDINLRIDITNGLGTLSLYTGQYLINRLSAPLGVSIQLSQVSKSLGGQLIGALSGGNSLTNGLIGGLTNLAIGGGFSDGAKAVQPRVSTVGGDSSGFSKYNLTPRLYTRFMELVDDDITSNGRPLCKVRQPKNVGGYMLIQDADVSINGTSTELATIRNYLEGGFYYE